VQAIGAVKQQQLCQAVHQVRLLTCTSALDFGYFTAVQDSLRFTGQRAGSRWGWVVGHGCTVGKVAGDVLAAPV
jgi:hypothetical protein